MPKNNKSKSQKNNSKTAKPTEGGYKPERRDKLQRTLLGLRDKFNK